MEKGETQPSLERKWRAITDKLPNRQKNDHDLLPNSPEPDLSIDKTSDRENQALSDIIQRPDETEMPSKTSRSSFSNEHDGFNPQPQPSKSEPTLAAASPNPNHNLVQEAPDSPHSAKVRHSHEANPFISCPRCKETISIPASPPSKMSDISPLRSFVFLGLVTTTVMVTSITVVEWHKYSKRSKPYDPVKGYDPLQDYRRLMSPELYPRSMVMPVFCFVALTTYLVSIAGAMVMIVIDRTKERRAMATHFMVSVWLSFVLCCGKAGSVARMTDADLDSCVNMVIWTTTVGMISAIWMRGGLKALKREAMAVPGNLWLVLYEGREG